MLKKIISFAVTAAMLITMVCAFSFASAEGLMKITAVADKTEVHRGDTVTVTVGLANYSPVANMVVRGNFDKSVLRVKEISLKRTVEIPGLGSIDVQYFPGLTESNDNFPLDENGPIYIVWANSDDQTMPTDSFPVAVVTFEILDDAVLDETGVQFFFESVGHWNEAEGRFTNLTPDVDYTKNADPLILNVQA